MISILLIFVLFLAGCGSQTLYMCADGTPGGNQFPDASKELIYVCPDGLETDQIYKCKFVNKLIISPKNAELKSINFVNGYVRVSGWSATLINVYPEEGNFYAQLVLSKYEEQPYETLIQVHGETGLTTCVKNCKYTV